VYNQLTSHSTILRGVPTNNQLTITILRLGEVHDTPLPPVPSSKPEDADLPADVEIGKVPLGASRMEVAQAAQPASSKKSATANESEDDSQGGTRHKHISKFIHLVKRTTRGGVDAKAGFDNARAKAGSKTVKNRLGVFSEPEDLSFAKPDEFKARFDGKSGWVYITNGANPRLLFSTQSRSLNGRPDKVDPIFEIAVGDIQVLKRAQAIVTEATKKAVEWSSEKEVLASLEFEDQSGNNLRFTALPERDELFNRLVAIGGQHWETM
jgi:hypothetical protein